MHSLAKQSIAKNKRYARRKHRTNTIAKETSLLPRLVINRSNKHVFAQVIAKDGSVIAVASDAWATWTKSERAFATGEAVAASAIKAWCEKVVFDRNGFLYHGRVKQLAEGARKGWLQF